MLTRVHGGAVLHQQVQFRNNSFIRRYQQNAAAKLAIAREAAALVSDDASILLDASSTAYYFAQALSKHQRLRVMTNGFDAARELAQNTTNTVILIGGVVDNESSSVTGLLSEHIIEELHIQKAFLSCSGFSLEHGMTEVQLAEAQLKRKVIESSQELFALVDSSKFGMEDLTSFARPSGSAACSRTNRSAFRLVGTVADRPASRLRSAKSSRDRCGEDLENRKPARKDRFGVLRETYRSNYLFMNWQSNFTLIIHDEHA